MQNFELNIIELHVVSFSLVCRGGGSLLRCSVSSIDLIPLPILVSSAKLDRKEWAIDSSILPIT